MDRVQIPASLIFLMYSPLKVASTVGSPAQKESDQVYFSISLCYIPLMWTYRSGCCCDQTLWVGKAVQTSYPHSSVVALVGILIYQYSSPSDCQLSVVRAKFKFNIETTRCKYIEIRLNIKINRSIKSQPEFWILSFHSSYNPTSDPLFKPNVSSNLPKK